MNLFNIERNTVGDREFMYSNVLTYDSSKFFFPNSNYLQMTIHEGLNDKTTDGTKDYCEALNIIQEYATKEKESKCNMSKPNLVEIKNVIFNPPATIVFWTDNSKTVVKAENEIFDPEKGLAMAIAKKALGNKGNYYKTFKKWLPKKESKEEPKTESKDCAAEEQSKKNGCHNCAFYSRSIIERPCNNCNPYKHSEWKPMYTLSDAEDDDNVL